MTAIERLRIRLERQLGKPYDETISRLVLVTAASIAAEREPLSGDLATTLDALQKRRQYLLETIEMVEKEQLRRKREKEKPPDR